MKIKLFYKIDLDQLFINFLYKFFVVVFKIAYITILI